MERRTTWVLVAALCLVAAMAVYWYAGHREMPPRGTPEVARSRSAAVDHSAGAKPQAPRALPEENVSMPAAPLGESQVVRATPGQAPAVPPLATATPAPREPTRAVTQADAVEIQTELESVQTMIRDYRNLAGGNPVGTNAEIMQAVLGANDLQVKIPLPEGSHLTGEGELADRWGTPYFFHQLSATHMEIRSAGPDRQMWTSDDFDLP